MPVECVDIYRLRDAKIVRVDVHYKEPGALAELCRQPAGSDLAPAAPGPSPSNTCQTNRGELT